MLIRETIQKRFKSHPNLTWALAILIVFAIMAVYSVTSTDYIAMYVSIDFLLILLYFVLTDVTFKVDKYLICFGLATLIQPSIYAIYTIAGNEINGSIWGIIFLIVMMFLAGLSEELCFRGIAYETLTIEHSFIFCAILSSAVFALFHFAADISNGLIFSILAVLNAFFFGISFMVLYKRTQNIIMLSIIHGLYNTIMNIPSYLSIEETPSVALYITQTACNLLIALLLFIPEIKAYKKEKEALKGE